LLEKSVSDKKEFSNTQGGDFLGTANKNRKNQSEMNDSLESSIKALLYDFQDDTPSFLGRGGSYNCPQ